MGAPPAPKAAILNVKSKWKCLLVFRAQPQNLSPDHRELSKQEPNFPAWAVSWEEPNWPSISQGLTIIIVPFISQKPLARPGSNAIKKKNHKNMNGPSRMGSHFPWLMAHPVIPDEPNPKF